MTALLGVRTRLRLARTFVLAEAAPVDSVLDGIVAPALSGGADIIGLDLRGGSASQVRAKVRTACELVRPRNKLIAVWSEQELGGDPDRTGFGGADLVLTRGPVPVPEVVADAPVVGVLVDDPADLEAALQNPGIGFVVVAGDRASGDALVEAAVAAAPVSRLDSTPWFCLIRSETAESATISAQRLLSLGARRLAVATAVGGEHLEQLTRSIDQLLDQAWAQDPELGPWGFSRW